MSTPVRTLVLVAATLGTVRAGGTPVIRVEPTEATMDAVVRIVLSGMPAGKTVTLRAETDQRGQTWRSHAEFAVGDHGNVYVNQQAPTAGSYKGVDPMGLFWAMEPVGTPPKEPPPALKVTDPRATQLSVEIDGAVVSTYELVRWYAKPGVRGRDVRADGLVGKLFEPAKPGRYPAILVLSGSDGGVKEADAALLASHGYTALALAYFGIDGVPKTLVQIPLEYLKKGIDWLKTQDSVDPDRLGVMGSSKGGELSLLLAATYPDFKAVVANVPSHVVWSGIGGTYSESSWTLGGKPVPFVQAKPSPALFAGPANKPIAILGMYEAGLTDEARERAAVIPVEKINGAVLVISGKDDQMWPSAAMAEKVVARLKEHKHPHPYRHLSYDGAGHGIVSAHVPLKASLVSGRFALGGSPEANAKAVADSRPKVLQFLDENLRKR